MLNIQNYIRAESLEQAYQLNQNRKNRILGGMLWLKMSDISVPTAIDLCELGLDTIQEREDEFSIGAMVTLRQLEQHEGLQRYSHNAVKEAVQDIVGVQFRNMATVGGSLFGRFGFSDVLTVFLTMDSYVELHKGGIVPLEKFSQMEKDRDILVRLIVKKTQGSFAYQAMRNSQTDFPMLTCGVSNVGGTYRLAVGARPGLAVVLQDRQGLLAHGLQEQAIRDFSDFAAREIPTGSNLRCSAAYRTRLVKSLTWRALQKLEG